MTNQSAPPTTRTRSARLRTAPTVEQAEPPAAVLPPPNPPVAGVPPAPPAPPVELPPIEAVQAAVVEPSAVPIPGSPFHLGDVVQIIDPGSRHYGMFFIIADVRHGKAHGFYMVEGLKKEFITIPMDHLYYIGPSKVRAKVMCSPKWISDNR